MGDLVVTLAWNVRQLVLFRSCLASGVLLLAASFACAQRPGQGPPSAGGQSNANNMQVTLTINLRDSSGVPLDAPGVVNLRGGMQNVVRMASTQEASAAVFSNVGEGEYDAEARCVGY